MLELSDNTQFVELTYGLAVEKLTATIEDWNDTSSVIAGLNALGLPLSLVFRVVILDSQVVNGGIIQYFDNGYGIHAYETLNDLKLINANKRHDLLKQCLEAINPDNLQGKVYCSYIESREYDMLDTDKLEGLLDRLDDMYYSLEDEENIDSLTAHYLRNKSH